MSLTGQSEGATVPFRKTLGENQKAANAAILSSEAASRGMAGAILVGGQAWQTIKVLVEALEQMAEATSRIGTSAGQQATVTAQISQAMRDIDQVARRNVAAIYQVQPAARNLTMLSNRLAGIVATEPEPAERARSS
jgi:methyl-accepting chemotaxis protein